MAVTTMQGAALRSDTALLCSGLHTHWWNSYQKRFWVQYLTQGHFDPPFSRQPDLPAEPQPPQKNKLVTVCRSSESAELLTAESKFRQISADRKQIKLHRCYPWMEPHLLKLLPLLSSKQTELWLLNETELKPEEDFSMLCRFDHNYTNSNGTICVILNHAITSLEMPHLPFFHLPSLQRSG